MLMKNDDYTLLIGIGAQKSGTSWVSRYFADHKSVFMSPIKELHLFDAETSAYSWKHVTFINKFRKLAESLDDDQFCGENYLKLCTYLYRIGMINDESMYKRFFSEFRNEEKVVCEISPAYSTLSTVEFRTMAEIHHTVKFLFIMRNPVNRFWSQLKYKSMREKFNHLEKFEDYLSDPIFTLRTDYRRTITELLSVVDKNNVHFIFYENLFSDQAITSLCAFLDIDYMQADFSNRVNPTFADEIDASRRQRAFSKFHFVYEYINDYFKGEIPLSWKQDMVNYG
jgi:hypothetical protein